MRHVIPLALSEQAYLILASVADRPKHGYLLLTDVERLSANRVRLSTGTLYGALRRMLEEDWIERCDCSDDSRDKQCYRVTKRGLSVLRHEHERLNQLAGVSRGLLRTREA
jgi:DNA-binding PadR family transcriptional regulator